MKKLVPITILSAVATFILAGCADILPHYTDDELVYIAEEGTNLPASTLTVVPGTVREVNVQGDYDFTKAVDFRVNSTNGAQFRCNFTYHDYAFQKNYHYDVQCTQISGPPAHRKSTKKSSKSAPKKMKDG